MMTLAARRIRRHRGGGLVEVLVALFLSVVLVGIVIQVFISSKLNYSIQERLSRMQENARQAVESLSRDLRSIGFIGEVQEYWNITSAAAPNLLPVISGECFTSPYRWVAPMVAVGGVYPPSLVASNNGSGKFSGCITTANYQPNTDVISIHYGIAEAIADASLQANTLYLRTYLRGGMAFKCQTSGSCLPVGAPAASPTTANFALYAASYYIRPWQSTVGDGVPALIRAKLDSVGCASTPPCIKHETIAEGIEDLQIRFGVDNDDDGFADQYLDAQNISTLAVINDVKAWHRVTSIRLWLLMRSDKQDPSFTDENTYVMGDRTFSPKDGYRRSVVSTTIALRNVTGAQP